MTVVHERDRLESARRAMIDSQLRVSGVNDPAILTAFAAVAREDHVPAAQRQLAYIDRAVPLGDGAVLAPALTHGQMLTAAELAAGERVAVIGAPGGYLAALVRELGAHATVIAPGADLAGHGPVDAVLIDGAVGVVPDGLAALLGERGRVITGWIERSVARLALGRVVGGEVVLTKLAEADFAPLAAYAVKPRWSF